MSATPWSDGRGAAAGERAFESDHILVRFHDDIAATSTRGQQLTSGFNLRKVSLPDDVTIDAAIASYQQFPGVQYAEPDYHLSASDWYTSDPPAPNDNLYKNSMMWGLHNNGSYEGIADKDIDAPEAWLHTRGTGMTVAVIDSGVDYTHPDLQTNMWVNSGETAGNGLDDDQNGYIDDVHGWDFANNDPSPMDDNGHGTHVAGTVAAIANNDDLATGTSGTSQSVLGVAPEAKIMALKFLTSKGSGATSNAIRALDYAAMMKVPLSNHSYGGTTFSQAFLDAIERATQNGHVLVAAAGNGGSDGVGDNNDKTPQYPASYRPTVDSVIAVAASDSSDSYTRFSNYGSTSVDLAAPGLNIWSTVPQALDTSDGTQEGLNRKNGTSMAAPHVAGAAALVWSMNSGLTAMEVKEKLMATTDPIGGSKTVTNGRLNAAQAVAAVRPADSKPVVAIESPTAGSTVSGSVVITATASDDNGVSQVEFFVNGTSQGIGTPTTSADGGTIWTSSSWDAATAADGSYVLKAVATDTIGQNSNHEITVKVDNVNDAPSASIISPTDGATVGGLVTISATASDDRGVGKVEFFLNGSFIGEDNSGTDGWSLQWDSKTVASQGYTLTVVAYDSEGVQSAPSDPVQINVSQVTTIAGDDFNSGTYNGGSGWSGDWSRSGDAYIYSGTNSFEGSHHARLRRGSGYLQREVNLQGQTWSDVTLVFYAKVTSFENSDKAIVKVSGDGSNWTTVKTFMPADSNNLYAKYEIKLSGNHSRLILAFDAQMNSTNDYWYIDAVQISGTRV